MLSPMLTLEGPKISGNAFKQGLSDNFMLSLRQKCIIFFKTIIYCLTSELFPAWDCFSPTVGTI